MVWIAPRHQSALPPIGYADGVFRSLGGRHRGADQRRVCGGGGSAWTVHGRPGPQAA